MKNKIIYIIPFMLFSIIANAQNFIINPDYTFEKTKQYWDNYFSKIDRNDKYGKIIFGEGGEYDHYKEFIEYWGPRISDGKTFDSYIGMYGNVITKMFSSVKTRANIDPWNEIGPINSPLNDEFWGQGLVDFVKICKDNISYMLAGSSAGGLFYSTDNGENWLQSGSDTKWLRSECNDAIFRPGYPNTWFAVNSGHGWGTPNCIGNSGGIWRTTDKGSNWSRIATYANIGNDQYNIVRRIEIDPVNTNILYVATNNGLFKTTNCNDLTPTWSAVLLNGFIKDIKFKPNSSILYATQYLNSTWNILSTSDGGITWQTITPPNSSWGITTCLYGAITLEIKPNNFLYGLVTDDYINSKIYKYDLSQGINGNWTVLNPSYDLSQSHGGGYAFAVSPNSVNDELFVSTGIKYARYINGTWSGHTTNIHDDIQRFAYDPTIGSSIVWVSTDGGVYKSTDNGNNWVKKSKGLAVANITRFATSYTNPEFINIALRDNSNMLTTNLTYTSPYKPDWKKFGAFGDGLNAFINCQVPDTIYASTQAGGWVKSSNRGQTYSDITVPTGWYSAGDINKVNSTILYRSQGINKISDGNYQYENMIRSLDGGKTNETILSDINTLIGYGTCSGIWEIYAPDYFIDYVYAHVYICVGSNTQHYLLRTKNANTIPASSVVWEVLTLPFANTIWFGDFKTDYNDPDIVYLSCTTSKPLWDGSTDGKEMFYKIDYNNTIPVFIDLTGNVSPNIFTNKLPNCQAEAIAVEKGSDGGIYLSTDVGVYYINNKLITSGYGWNNDLALSNLPRIAAEFRGLQINYKINKIRIATSGRGVWEHDLFCPADNDITESSSYDIDKFLEVNNNINSTAIINSGLNINYRAGNQIKLEPGFKALSGSKFDAFIHPCNKSGNSFRSPVNEDKFVKESDKKEDIPLKEKYFVVIPNPNNGNMTFNYELPENETGKFEIYDLIGNKVYSNSLRSGKNSLSIKEESLKQGVYFYKVFTGNKVIGSDKIVVIK